MTALDVALELLRIDQALRRANTPDDERDAMLFAAEMTLACNRHRPPEQRLLEDAPVSERPSERSKDSVEEKV